MRVFIAASVMALSFIASTAQAADPCKAVICLAGEVMGQGGGSACSDAIQDYFGIQVWKHGNFKPSATANKRAIFLNSCQADDGGFKKEIGDKFGKLLSM